MPNGKHVSPLFKGEVLFSLLKKWLSYGCSLMFDLLLLEHVVIVYMQLLL
jgi:hypothetical protein